MRPAGGGVYLVSTGLPEQVAFQRRYDSASTEEEVQRRFLERLARIGEARAVLIGIPSDTGAGNLRGANMGPQAIRQRLLEQDPGWRGRAEAAGLLDLGDVFVVPQLLHDEMLSTGQKLATRRAIYPSLSARARRSLPVSPLSMAERVLSRVLEVNPAVKPIVLGGDHSTAWPVVRALAAARPKLAVVQIDAHTDLLEERLGVRYCFGTWSFHANELLGRGGRLVQVGIRASGHDRAHWEQRLDVRQFWAKDVRADAAAAMDGIVEAVKRSGAEAVYFSNDIDGTDASWADATGTPEPEGLTPDFVVELVRRLGREIGLAGGDVMEVAPLLARTPGGPARTLDTAVRYLRETVEAAIGVE
jgi:agmatinase